MAFGKIPRFSPSFSPKEALISARHLLGHEDHATWVKRFEETFARYIGAKYAVMVPSARYGCYLLLKAMGVGPGDEVIVPSMTYFAIPAMVSLIGAKPVWADIGLTSHVIDPENFRAAITKKTKAVIPTHLFGTPCDMDPITKIAAEHGVKVIEDCAQSTGARYKGRRVGSIGDAAYYTFGLTKNITTLSGAMITTDDERVAAEIRATIDAGEAMDPAKARKEAVTGLGMFVATHPAIYWASLHPAIVIGNMLGKDPIHEPFGEAEVVYDKLPSGFKKTKPLSVNAAVGLHQLARIDELNGARVKNGRVLDERLAHVPGLTVPTYPSGAEPIYMSFVVHHARRDDLAKALRKRGVDTTVGYMNDMSDHELFPQFRDPKPNAARAKQELLHLPVHPNLSERDRDHLCEAVREACLEVKAS